MRGVDGYDGVVGLYDSSLTCEGCLELKYQAVTWRILMMVLKIYQQILAN